MHDVARSFDRQLIEDPLEFRQTYGIGSAELTVCIPSGNMKLICRVLSFGKPGRSRNRVTVVIWPSGWQPLGTLYIPFSPPLAAQTQRAGFR